MTVIRIVVVGEGREKFGHVFLADTGTSNGDITGQTRPINTVDFKVSDLIVCVYCILYCTVLYSVQYTNMTSCSAQQTFPHRDRQRGQHRRGLRGPALQVQGH